MPNPLGKADSMRLHPQTSRSQVERAARRRGESDLTNAQMNALGREVNQVIARVRQGHETHSNWYIANAMVEVYEQLLHGHRENEVACATPETLSDLKALFTKERISAEINTHLERSSSDPHNASVIQELITRAAAEIADLVANCQAAKRTR